MFGTLDLNYDDEGFMDMETEIQQLKQQVSTYEKQKSELEAAVVSLNIKFRGSSEDSKMCRVVCRTVTCPCMLQV